MSEARVPGSAPRTGDELVDAAEAVGATMVRVGVTMVGWPFYFLPARLRRDALNATTDLFSAVGALHLSLTRAAIRGLDVAATEINRAVSEPARPTSRAATHVPIETAPPPAQ